MEELSVLDYVKSKLAFWKQTSLEIPSSVAESDQAIIDLPVDETISLEETAHLAVEYRKSPARFPWLPLAALGLALIGQILLEPAERSNGAAVVFYLIATVAMVVAALRREVKPVLPPAGFPLDDDLRIRWEGVAVGAVLMLLAFLTFGAQKDEPHNFTFINTAFWLISIGYLVWSFAIFRPGYSLGDILARARSFLQRPAWKINLSRWAVLLFIVIGVVLFFRWYRLSGVPSDMVSDHAEKLLDVQDVLNGQLHTFFPRNTGREFFQFYWTVLMIKFFQIPVSFMALKVGMVIAGLITLIYIYRLGFELGNKWVALFALAFCGVSYWANVQARIALRFTLYPLFVAPLFFYLLRGFRTSNRNDFIKAGLVLGLGLNGYTSYRIVPLVVVVAFGLYILHESSKELRRRAVVYFGIVVLISFAVFIPLFRYALDNPDLFAYRTLTRLSSEERPLPGSPVQIMASNFVNAMLMFQVDDGDVWVHSVTHRPALDVVSAVLFFLGVVVLLVRYIRRRHWIDLFLLVSIPLLLLPSMLSLAFPNENPNLNRTAGAYVVVFLIVGILLDALLKGVRRELGGKLGLTFATILGLALFGWAAGQNYYLLFVQYANDFQLYGWNTSEMGAEVQSFEKLTGSTQDYVVAYPYWVDTRLVGIEAGHPARDMAITADQFSRTLSSPGAKLFLLKPEDEASLAILRQLYPQGRAWLHSSPIPGKDFIEFMTLSQQGQMQPQTEP